MVFTPVPGAESTGIGAPGSVQLAAAIANAVFAASGARVRRLPLTQAAVAAAGDRGLDPRCPTMN